MHAFVCGRFPWQILMNSSTDKGDAIVPKEIKKRLTFKPDHGIVLKPDTSEKVPAEFIQSLFAVLQLLKKSRPSFVKYV